MPIDWVWKPWLARGQFHLLVGQPGVGKTTLAVTLAARLSAGSPPFKMPGKVLLCCLEDDWSLVLKQRMIEAGMNEDNVTILESAATSAGQERPIQLEHDLPAITERARNGFFRLIAVDPVIRVAGGARDSHNATDVRRTLDPLVQLAKDTDAAVLGVSHFRKSKAVKRTGLGGGVLDEVMGSQAWGAVARIVIACVEAQDTDGIEPDFKYVAGLIKSNLHVNAATWPYDIEPTGPNGDVSVLRFGGEDSRNLSKIIDGCDTADSPIDRACRWIRDNVPPGVPVPSAETEKDALAATGVSQRTLADAKKLCLIQSVKPNGVWSWSRPE